MVPVDGMAVKPEGRSRSDDRRAPADGRPMSAVPAPPPAIAVDPALARAGLRGRRVGAHLPIRDGLLRTAARAQALGASALQVFTDDPRAWAPRTQSGNAVGTAMSAASAQ